MWSCPEQNHGDRHHRLVVDRALLVAGGDPPVLLEPVEAALDPVALAVGGLVEAGLAGLVGFGGDHHPDPAAAQPGPHDREAVALVASDPLGPDPGPTTPRAAGGAAGAGSFDRRAGKQRLDLGDLVALATGEGRGHRLAAAFDAQVQLGGVAATAAPQCLILRVCDPFFGRLGPDGGAPRRRAGGRGRRCRPGGAAASQAPRPGRPGSAAPPAPDPRRPGGASRRSGPTPWARGRSGRAGRATASRSAGSTRWPPRSAGGRWVGGPSWDVVVAAAGPAVPTAHRSVLARFVP